MKIVLYGLLCIFQFTIFTEAKRHARMIDGENTRIEDYPHQVSIRKIEYKGGRKVLTHQCAGSIVSERHIVTAAHCFKTKFPLEMKVVSSTNRSDTVGQLHDIKNITTHPDYSPTNPRIYNDIAVLTLSKPMKFNSTQQPIDLPKQDVRSRSVGTIIGWGVIPTTKKYSIGLQKAQVTILNTTECLEHVTKNNNIINTQLCGVSYQHGITGGDSGGPLIVDGQLVGVISGFFERNIRITDVFSNVYAFMKFVNDTIKST